MLARINLTDIAALAGAITGTIALVLSLLNYRRETPKVVIKLFWDRKITNNPKYDSGALWGLVQVTNTGRRPIYIRLASLKLPKGYNETHLVLQEGLAGQRLAEGDPPAHYTINQAGMQKYAKDWRKIRAVIFDSTDKEYVSKKLPKTPVPSWGKPL